VTGLFTVIPLGVTAIILYYLVKGLSRIGSKPAELVQNRLEKSFGGGDPEGLMRFITTEWFRDCMAVLIVIALVYFLGMLTSNLVGRKLVKLFEWFMDRIPFVRSIYGGMRKLVDLLQQDTGADVQRVVLIEFPSSEMKAVGLVTRTFADKDTGRKLAAVYVPTTPNPTNGYVEIVPVDRIISTNWSFDEAISFIVSGGAVAPDQIPYSKSEGKLLEPKVEPKP
tara:strand:+ start:3960 stop:4631 length:672 start_codon:yes stop_codon:yes gene_type:complete